jgi:hypothetical protein
MVKFNIATVRQHAANDAIERTLRLSEKPQVGAVLIPAYSAQRDVFPDLDALQSILSQRSIYDKLDAFKLRAPSASINATTANLVRLESHWTEAAGRAISADLHNKISRLPLDQTSEGHNLLDLQSVRSQNDLRRTLRAVVKAAEASRLTYDSIRDIQQDTLLISNFAFKLWNNVEGNTIGIESKASAKQSSSYDRINSTNCICKTGKFQKTSLCDACGFGTAPIWYQQSMENGPP